MRLAEVPGGSGRTWTARLGPSRARYLARQYSSERLQHDVGLRRDMLLVAKGGWWMHGQAANELVRARATDIGTGAAYYDERVRIETPPA